MVIRGMGPHTGRTAVGLRSIATPSRSITSGLNPATLHRLRIPEADRLRLVALSSKILNEVDFFNPTDNDSNYLDDATQILSLICHPGEEAELLRLRPNGSTHNRKYHDHCHFGLARIEIDETGKGGDSLREIRFRAFSRGYLPACYDLLLLGDAEPAARAIHGVIKDNAEREHSPHLTTFSTNEFGRLLSECEKHPEITDIILENVIRPLKTNGNRKTKDDAIIAEAILSKTLTPEFETLVAVLFERTRGDETRVIEEFEEEFEYFQGLAPILIRAYTAINNPSHLPTLRLIVSQFKTDPKVICAFARHLRLTENTNASKDLFRLAGFLNTVETIYEDIISPSRTLYEPYQLILDNGAHHATEYMYWVLMKLESRPDAANKLLAWIDNRFGDAPFRGVILPRILRAMGTTGNPLVLSVLLNRPHFFWMVGPALVEIVENYRPSRIISPTQVSSTLKEVKRSAALIRGTCRKYANTGEDLAHGYGNRGIRPGHRTLNTGRDYVGTRMVPASEADLRFVDWNAASRVQPESGMLPVKEFRTEEANHVVIYIDPYLLRPEQKRESLQLLAGTLAQMALQKKDMVRLVIGRKRYFIAPSNSPAQLERILHGILSYMGPVSYDAELSKVINTHYLGHLPPGSQVFVVTEIENNYFAQLDALKKRWQGHRITVTPVVTAARINVVYPTIKIGRHRIVPNHKQGIFFTKVIAHEKQAGFDKGIARLNGIGLDLTKISKEPVIVDETAKATQALERNHQVKSNVEVTSIPMPALIDTYEDFTSPEPPDFLARLEVAYEKFIVDRNAKELIFILRLATINGWSSALDFIEAKYQIALQTANEMTHSRPGYNAASLKKSREAYTNPSLQGHLTINSFFRTLEMTSTGVYFEELKRDIWHLEYFRSFSQTESEWQAAMLKAYYSPNRSRFYLNHIGMVVNVFGATDLLLECHSIMELREQVRQHPELYGYNDKGTNKTKDKLSTYPNLYSPPTGSAAASPTREGEAKVWMRFSTPLRGRQQYLRSRMGIALGNNSFTPISAINSNTLYEKSRRKIRAKTVMKIKPGMIIPSPTGGRFEKVGFFRKKSLRFSMGSSALPVIAQAVLAMPLADLKAQGKAIYGDDLYLKATAAPTLQDIAEFAPEIAAEWEALLSEISVLNVKEALDRIQQYLLNHKTITYHHYASETEKTIFTDLLNRISSGTSEPNEYLRFILRAKGGVCAEMSFLAVTLIRLAGIPAGQTTGWVAEPDNSVKMLAHAWPEALLPNGEGRYSGLPVEVSRDRATPENMIKEITKQQEPTKMPNSSTAKIGRLFDRILSALESSIGIIVIPLIGIFLRLFKIKPKATPQSDNATPTVEAIEPVEPESIIEALQDTPSTKPVTKTLNELWETANETQKLRLLQGLHYLSVALLVNQSAKMSQAGIDETFWQTSLAESLQRPIHTLERRRLNQSLELYGPEFTMQSAINQQLRLYQLDPNSEPIKTIIARWREILETAFTI